VLVIAAHVAYVVGCSLSDNKPARTLIAPLFSILAALVAFTPWALVILRSGRGRPGWMSMHVGISQLLSRWIVDFAAIFFDVNLGFSNSLTRLVCILILLLMLYALAFLSRRSARRIWLLVVALIGAPGLALMLPDFVLGGRL